MRTLIALIISTVIAIPVLAMPPGDGSQMLKGMTRQLNLTDEQQAQVKAILESKKAEMEAIRAQMQTLHAQTNAEIKTVLNPEQIKKFETMQEKRRERFENKREHHERGYQK
ncbi:MAG: Spy/CpxP family protein refolding chaperone [Ketobacter sp.]|jgi:periplasmic protein CpxP/Spy|uniref:Spy/CpxP family protein refolding chaperone n=1 Tax=unclassified Ketobacter TaxID=2639109 RepID=UPI0025C04A9D|nr:MULTISPECIES: Spy/CpxP family protein refolding chaperone [unclassified Ketobacter]MCK5792088.1 Spy/CpxP family protein refolding chaperone [Ketobacter sp.]MEC8811913.1 Spy/CpxP family protein refolding chaperone [Pseudomonadota bacterium]|tara:strand:- start:6836 stop:7171 length:336 start_codon:yes stop_codon:yes gene_type:complete